MLLLGEVILAKAAMAIRAAPKGLFITFVTATGRHHNISAFF
jgi:hypothetical protein